MTVQIFAFYKYLQGDNTEKFFTGHYPESRSHFIQFSELKPWNNEAKKKLQQFTVLAIFKSTESLAVISQGDID